MNQFSPTVTEETSEQVTRSSGSSFYYSFLFLPPKKREAITGVYAFCRLADNVIDEADSPAQAKEKLALWYRELELCYTGQPSHPITRRLQGIIREFKIPQEYFQELLRGVEMDLTHKRYATFEELYRYCYRVASVVGLICIEIFGYQNPKVKEHAIHQGLAFQLTNILRDVRVDSELGRIYLPQEDLKRFHYTEEDLFAHTYNPSFRALMHFEAERAKEYYRRAKALIPKQDRPALIASEIMGAIYYCLLIKMEKRGYNVFSEIVRLSSFHKMVIALWTWGRIKLDQSVA